MKTLIIVLAVTALLVGASLLVWPRFHDARLAKEISGTWNGDTNAVMVGNN